MPINNFPLITHSDGRAQAYLRIRITNPHKGRNYLNYGLVDTGADECVIPAAYAPLLGHDLHAANSSKEIITGSGVTIVYPHTTKIDILHPITGEIIYTTENMLVDFMPNLNITLLGVKNFLGKFILNINYPENKFSLNIHN